MTYLKSSGDAANGANFFTYQSGWSSSLSFAISTTSAAYSGVAEEATEAVRYNAPRSWIAQNRALTAVDYENLLLSSYSNIETIRAWGGQDNVPKVYGKVFICAKPFGAEYFSPGAKQDMIDSLLKKRGIVSVTPEFVDPEYMNVELTANVYYNSATSGFTAGEIQTKALAAIATYSDTLSKFDSVFRYSNLTSAIDAIDKSVTNNSVNIRVRVPYSPFYKTSHTYTRLTNNPIAAFTGGGSFYSTRFYTLAHTDRAYFRDNGAGLIFLITEDAFGNPTTRDSVGTIDYTNGQWTIPSFNIQYLQDPIFEFVFVPAANDVVSNRNIIVRIRDDLTTCNVIADNISSGTVTGGANYTFTAVR
jgi:hypothetical protein